MIDVLLDIQLGSIWYLQSVSQSVCHCLVLWEEHLGNSAPEPWQLRSLRSSG